MKDYGIRVLRAISQGAVTVQMIGAEIDSDSRSTGGLLSRLMAKSLISTDNRYEQPRVYRVTPKGNKNIERHEELKTNRTKKKAN